jgi:aminoglycoside phosphotransferase (APT) family kinase protein
MVDVELSPSAGSLEEVRRLAGSSAAIESVTRLEGGQHADTWRVGVQTPELTVVVRQFPVGDPAAAHEERVLKALDGLDGLAPILLSSDLDGRWSTAPTLLLSWLDGEADITPIDPENWAVQLGRALATVHAVPSDRLRTMPSVFDRSGSSQQALAGPLTTRVRCGWPQITASAEVLTHCDYWSGNVVWRDGKLTGVVDWSGGASGPRGFDVGWCRLDLVLLFDEHIADLFSVAYLDSTGGTIDDMALWDAWALARSHDMVETWTPNYAPLGRPDLTRQELRRRHSGWTACLLERT